jgi:hypothetical protein
MSSPAVRPSPSASTPDGHPSESAPAARTPNRPAALNRSLLSLVGLILLLGGAFVLAAGLGLLPSRLGPVTLPGRAASLLPAGLTLPWWASWATVVVAAVVALLCLRWLVAQLSRRPATQTWRLTRHRAATGETEQPAGTTRMDAAAAAAAVAADVESYTGVDRASAVLSGDRSHPELHLTVATTDDADVRDLRHRIDTHALPRLRQALELDSLPAELLLRVGVATRSTADKLH